MKWIFPPALLVSLSFVTQDGEVVRVLKRADLKPFEGTWVMAVDTKKGWKGTIRATVTVYDAGSKNENFGRILYAYDLARGNEKSVIENAPAGGIGFAVVSRGKKLSLVTAEREGFGPTVPFKVDPKPALSAPVTVTEDKLVLDCSTSAKAFCFPFDDFDLDWGKLEFTRVKKDK